ncbi:MAG TPA: DUF1444 family protein [Rhodocyclaceae bacterium]|nr:DUF1444 family protein [Rhodocyclaceae bacterium]
MLENYFCQILRLRTVLYFFGGALLVLAGPLSAAECDLSYSQLRAEALDVLRSKFPGERFEPGKEQSYIQMGEVQLGLHNLRSKLCSSNSLNAEQRREELGIHFERVLDSLKNASPAAPELWSEARSRVRLQFMHSDYLKPFAGNKVLVSRAFVPEVHIAVVLDQPNGYVYVRESDRLKWKIDEKELFETALSNVDLHNQSAKLQGSGKPDPFLASEEKDGYDSVRLLLPRVRSEAARHLGNPFFASIPNRDFLIMWGTKNSTNFQVRARQNVGQDYATQPYKLSPLVLKIWADGRVEVAR